MNEIIEIINYEEESGCVYFKYRGEPETKVIASISWYGLTIFISEMTLSPNEDVVYYIAFDKTHVKELNNFDVIFESQNFYQTFNLCNNNSKVMPEMLRDIKVDKFDPSYYTYNEIFNQRIYDNKLVRILENDVVVDIGANYGFFAFYAKEFNPSKIICFEPSRKIYNHLKENINDCYVIQKAVSGKSGSQGFTDHIISSASSRLTDEGDYVVEIIGINEIHDSLGLDKIDFLKIDCEGAEKDIFEQITLPTIQKINKLVVEFHSEEIKEIIINKLDEFDFRIEKITDELIFAYNKDYFKKKKKIALVSTYCDTQEKKDIFLNLVKKVKSLGIDVMAISPLPLDKEHMDACDFIFFTKENPILKWPVRLFTFWREMPISDNKIATIQRGVGDYSWAALYHVKKLTQIAMDYDYDIFYHMVYDLDIDEVVKNAITNFEGNIVYPRRDPHHPETLWETTLHFMSFDKDLMKKIEKEITLEEYLSTNGVAEGEVLKWKKKFNICGSENPVRDLIFYWKDYDFFDYSPVKDFKLFLSKNEEIDIWLGENPVYATKLSSKLRIIFFGFKNLPELFLTIDGEKFEISPKPWEFIELPVDSKSINQIVLTYDNLEYDLTEKYLDISMNQIYYNHRP